MSAPSLVGDLAEGVFVLGEIFLLKRLDSSFFGYHRESRRIGRLKKFNRKSVEKQTKSYAYEMIDYNDTIPIYHRRQDI